VGDQSKKILALMLGLIAVSIAGNAELSRVIPASDVLAKIEAGQPAEFDNYTIVGDLNLSTLKFEGSVHFNHTLFQNSVHFNNSIFNDTAYFGDSSFNDPAYFGYSSFNGTAYFRGSSFNDTAYFGDSSFNDPAYFRGSSFNGTAYFRGSSFNDTAYFGDSRFRGFASFEGSRFTSDADIRRSSFDDAAYFRYSRFNGDADFGFSSFTFAQFADSSFNGDADFGYSSFTFAKFADSSFSGDSDFGYSSFNSSASFESSRFNGPAYFRGSRFNGDAYFRGSRFNGDASFGDSRFRGFASFEGSRFNKNTSFIGSQFRGYTSFNNASFNKGILQVGEDAIFSGTLDLDRSNINNIDTYIRWNNIGHLAYSIRAYNLLFDNYKKWGLFEDYNDCYYTFRKELLFQEPIGFMKFLDYLQWILNGFGMKPIFPILWSIGIILISGSIFYIANGIQRSNAKNSISVVYVPGYEPPLKPLKERIISIISQKRTISIGESMLFSATYFSSGANSIISSQPIDLSPVGVSRYIAVLERLLGWFFFALFLAALGNAALR
jgi:hypothetical protein